MSRHDPTPPRNPIRRSEPAPPARARPTDASLYLSDKDLAQRYRNSRATIWRWKDTRQFPKPIRLSPGCTRWKLTDVEQWEKEQVAAAAE